MAALALPEYVPFWEQLLLSATAISQNGDDTFDVFCDSLFAVIIELAVIATASKRTITNTAILILFPQQGESCEQFIFSLLFFSSVIFVFLNVMRSLNF